MITHRLEYKCDVCGAVVTPVESPDLPYGASLIRDYAPYGWNQIDSRLVCPNHQITIDGKTVRNAVAPKDQEIPTDA
jgi:hypothetical protein